MERNLNAPGERWSRQNAARLALVATVGLLAAAAFLLLSPRVEAKQQFMSLFGQAYPAAAGTPLDSCLLCHTNPSAPDEDNLNRYGRDWEDGDIGDKRFLAGALVRRDSDGDGVPNGQEIEQLSFPGDSSSSTPPATTTTIPGAPIDGQALYASRCAACHGPNGGNLSSTTLGRSTFISITRNGQGTMPAQSGLTKADAGAIWDYVTGAAPVITTTTTTIPGAPTTTTPPASGATIWANNCAVCHGSNGGNVVPTTLSTAQLTSIITNGIGSMRGFPELGAAQIGSVVDYLAGLSTATTTIPGAPTTTTPPASGATIWANNCAVCHGPAGGNLQGHTLSLAGITSATAGGVGTMPGFANRLSAAEITNVSAFVYGFSGGETATITTPTTTGTLQPGATLYLQTCSACHGIHGEGGSGGPVAGTPLSRMQTVGLITNGRGSMPGYASVLSMEEIEAVADHILGIAPSAGGEAPPPAEEVAVQQEPAAVSAAPSGPAETPPGLVAADPGDTLGALPGESAHGRWLAAFLVGTLGLAALVLWGRSLRNLTGWSKGQ